MATFKMSRRDIGSLCERMEARADSTLLRDRPELQGDMRIAAKLLRFMLENGMPVNPIELDTNGGGQ